MQNRRIHIVGRKNSGKTTLIVELLKEYHVLGIRVASIKHTSHDHELDVPGKDSFVLRKAGSEMVGIITENLTAIYQATEHGPYKYDTLERAMHDVDLILVEGDLSTGMPKIEVYRPDIHANQLPLIVEHPTISFVVTNAPLELSVPTVPRSDVKSVAKKILDLAGYLV
ncbi:MAG: molybdopterin-guanine dinucleotide biosynthesis protein B [Pirellulaceae bacterium]